MSESSATTPRYACYLFLVVVLTLWYALAPSRETRVRVADPSFKLRQEGDTRSLYTLSLELEQGRTYSIEEATRHTVTTRAKHDKGEFDGGVLDRTDYSTKVKLDLRVLRVSSGRIECKAVLRDFIGYEEDESKTKKRPQHEFVVYSDDDDEDEKDFRDRNKKMFEKVREVTKDTEFDLVLGHLGTVIEMDTSELRKRIITALHEVGQLPMHLEHAVVVGDYDVYPANGASFGPVGKTFIRGTVYRMKGRGCTEDHPVFKQRDAEGAILVVDRGECTFNDKAKLADKYGAFGLIVVDQEASSDTVMTYMSGEGDVPIVSVIVNKEAGMAIEDAIQEADDGKVLPNGDMVSKDQTVVQILGGLDAIKALNEDIEEDDDDDDDEDEKEEGLLSSFFSNRKPEKKLKSHNYNPVHSDGLHDFVGIGFVVDEVIRTRFSIFPPSPVTIGSSWERSLKLTDGTDPNVMADIKEEYKLTAVFKAGARYQGQNVLEDDLIAEIVYKQKEKPVYEQKNLGDKLPGVDDEDDEDDEAEQIEPQFSRPGFKGHEFTTKGTYYVHMSTGMVLHGESKSEAKAKRRVVIINRKNNNKKILKAKVEINAVTEYSGSLA